jgi:hypothetical protein
VEGRRQRAEGRGQRAEGRGQRAEGRGQRAEGRGQRVEIINNYKFCLKSFITLVPVSAWPQAVRSTLSSPGICLNEGLKH